MKLNQNLDVAHGGNTAGRVYLECIQVPSLSQTQRSFRRMARASIESDSFELASERIPGSASSRWLRPFGKVSPRSSNRRGSG
jgi:hypothetical protein